MRYIIESVSPNIFCVVDVFSRTIMKILSDRETAEEWVDYYNDMVNPELYRSTA